MKEKKIHLRLYWREEGRPARDFVTEEWQGSEFTAFSFCLLYPGLSPEEAHSLKTSRSDQKTKAPRKTLFLQPDNQDRGSLEEQKAVGYDFPTPNKQLGKDLWSTYTHLHNGCLWSRDFHLPLPTGVVWEYTEGKPELSPTLRSATLPSIAPPSPLPAGAQEVSGPQPPGTNEHPSASLWDGVLRGCLGRHGFYPLQLRKGTWCLVYYFYNALWIYNYLKTEKVKKRRNTFIKFWNCCSKLISNKMLYIFLSNVKWRLT